MKQSLRPAVELVILFVVSEFLGHLDSMAVPHPGLLTILRTGETLLTHFPIAREQIQPPGCECWRLFVLLADPIKCPAEAANPTLPFLARMDPSQHLHGA